MFMTNIGQFHQSEFMQTFGKASMQLKTQSNSSRNQFQSQKIASASTQYFMPAQKSKNALTFRANNRYESRTSQPSKQIMKKESSKLQLEHIDKINEKINGLIKSISASCQKLSSKAEGRPPRDSSKKPNQQALYQEEYRQNGKERNNTNQMVVNRIRFKSDLQKTQKKMSQPQCSLNQVIKQLKPAFDDTKHKWFEDKKVEKQLSFGQDYDQMSLRIKKINDKINNYELRIGGHSKKANNIHYNHDNLEALNSTSLIRPLSALKPQQHHQKVQPPSSNYPLTQNTNKKASNNSNGQRVIKSQTVASKTLKYKQQISMKLNLQTNASNNELRCTISKELKQLQKKGGRNKCLMNNKENVGSAKGVIQGDNQGEYYAERMALRQDGMKDHLNVIKMRQNYAKFDKSQQQKQRCPYRQMQESNSAMKLKNHEMKDMMRKDQLMRQQPNYGRNKNNIDNSPLPKRAIKQPLSKKLTFIKSLVRQIELDQDFRYNKYMFGGIEELQQQTASLGQLHDIKWTNLHSQLQYQGFNLSIKDVKEIFIPKDDQIDPFMSVSHCHEELIHGLIFAYQTAQRHWNENILRNQTDWELKSCGFTEQGIDRGRKGYISLQDLTFYLNTLIDGNYRNRDMLLVWQRFNTKVKHKCDTEGGVPFASILHSLLSL